MISDDPEDAAALCCLAIILSCRFQPEMAEDVALDLEDVPALRLSVCFGRDLAVELPNGQRDFVGDSVRHAVRACQFCHDNEILVDDTVLRWVHHDFVTQRLALEERRAEYPDAKLEHDMSFHILEELRPESVQDSEAPEYFVNTLAVLGRAGDATALAGRVATTLQNDAEGSLTDPEELNERFNRLLSSNLDYETVNRLLRDMRDAGLTPDVRTFNNLIAKSGDHDTQSRWLQRMRQEGVPPDVRTFTILVEQAANEATVTRWLTRMRKAGIVPDANLLNTLIDRAPDYEAAHARLTQMQEAGANATTYDLLIEKSPDVATGRQWIERMFEADIAPSEISFRSLFSKDLTGIAADDLLAWFLCQPYHPVEAIWRAIAEYRKAGRIDDALRLCLDYPYTQAAQRIFRAHPERTLAYFESILQSEPNHANGAYALGQALLTLNRVGEAFPWLQKAFALASPGPRREELARYLEQVQHTQIAEVNAPPLQK